MLRSLSAVLAILLASCVAPAESTRDEARWVAPVSGTHVDAPERPQVAIVGGGIAGLVTAYELERRGISVHLLEMADRLGGRISTATYGPGLVAEYGMQEIWSKSPLALLARELGLAMEGEGAFSSVVLDGKLHVYSQDSADEYLRSLFTPADHAELTRWMKHASTLLGQLHGPKAGEGLPPALAELNDISFATWLEEQKLPARVSAFLRLLLECELGASADRFSALSGLAELRMFVSGPEDALHINGGNSRLVEALAAKVRGPKSLRSRVTGIERRRGEDGQLKATVTFIRDNEVKQLSADRVVLTVPWMTLHMIQLDPPLPEQALDAVMTLGRGQYTVVHLLVDKKIHSLWGGLEQNPFPVLTSGPLGVIYGVAEPSPASQPLEVFSLLVHGTPAAAFHLASREAKRQEVVAGLDQLWPGFSGFVRGAEIYTYHPAAIPFWPEGRSPYDERAQGLFQPFDGLYLAGDYLVSSHAEGAVIAAQRQARAIAEELKQR